MKPNNASPTQNSSLANLHASAVGQALRLALGTSQPALRVQAVQKIANHLIHPRLILDSDLLAGNHIWKQEALLVADSFESVTNGMEEPGLLEALDSLEEDSFFQPWRHFILAVHFYYENLDEAVARHLSLIPSDSPLQILSVTLGTMAGLPGMKISQGSQRQLLEAASKPDEKVLSWVQDLAEGLETDQEELFWEALADWLGEVNLRDPEKAKAALLWAWNQLEWREFDEGIPLELGSRLWGQAESYRLAALGTLPWDPEGAALLWFRFLINAVRENLLDLHTLDEGCRLLERFKTAAREGGTPPEEWTETWNTLTRTWNAETAALGLAEHRINGEAAQVGDYLSSKPTDYGQLDLFS